MKLIKSKKIKSFFCGAFLATGILLNFLPQKAEAFPSSVFFLQGNFDGITISNQIADPYPSILTMSNMPTRLVAIAPIVINFIHTRPIGVDCALEGPQGEITYLFSDILDAKLRTNHIGFFDGFPQLPTNNLPVAPLAPGFYSPTDGSYFEANPDDFPAPAPPLPYPVSTGVFTNTNPNGNWNLYVTHNYDGIIFPHVDYLGIIQIWGMLGLIYSLNDFDGDNRPDVVFQKKKSIYVVNQTNLVNITKEMPPTTTLSKKGKVVAGGDLNGDGIADLLLRKGKTVEGLLGPGFTTSTHQLTFKGGKRFTTGDYNGDLIADLYIQKKRSLLVSINNNGTGFAAPTVVVPKKGLPKKFKLLGALSGRAQPTVIGSVKQTLVKLEGTNLNAQSTVLGLTKPPKNVAVGQYGADVTGESMIIDGGKKNGLSTKLINEENATSVGKLPKGFKLVAP